MIETMVNVMNAERISDLLNKCCFLALELGRDSIDENKGKTYWFALNDNFNIYYRADWGGRRHVNVRHFSRDKFSAYDMTRRDDPFGAPVSLDYGFDIAVYEGGDWEQRICDYYEGYQRGLKSKNKKS